MHYTKLIRSNRHETNESKPVNESEMVRLLREISKQTSQIPSQLREDHSLLSDYEVNDLLACALKFQEKYFKETIPLSKDLIQEFIYNIPKEVVRGVRHCQNHAIPDILNPMLLMYLFLTKNPFEAIGVFWKIVLPMLDDNREVIEKDAQTYLKEENENE